MKQSLHLSLAGIAAVFLLVSGAFARTLVVDNQHAAADDANPGTREAPLLTIQAAADLAQAGDTVLVRPGIYREAVSIGVSGRPDALITFESEKPHAAIVSGSDPAPAEVWTQSEPGVWRTTWPAPLRFNRHGNGEWVYADGVALLRVDTPDELMPGFFWLDFEENAVRVMLLEGRSPSDTALELASRDGLFRAGNWRTSQRLVEDAPWITDIVIRGFTVVHNADWFRGFAAIRVSGERWLVENNHVRWSTHMGLQISSTRDCVVRGNTVDWGGVLGVGGGSNLNLLFENNTVRYGNFRRKDISAEGGGSKFVRTLDSVFSGNLFVENWGSGLWFDGGNDAILIRNNRATDNLGHGGFFTEIDWHHTYDGNVSAYNEVGILIAESPGCIAHRNIVCGNSRYGIRLRGTYNRPAGMSPQQLADRRARQAREIPNIPEARLDQSYYAAFKYVAASPRRLSNNSAIMENLIFDNRTAYIEYRIYGDSGDPLAPFVQNFSEHNLYWPRDEDQKLFAGPAGYVYPDGLAGWQSASNRDLQSVVADPLDPETDLPEWVRDHPFLQEPRLRLDTDLVAAGFNIVKSPETARLYARLRRAGTLTPIELPSAALRACRFTLDNEDWVALWSTEDRGRRYLTLRVDAPEVIVEDAYGLQRTLPAHGGRVELGLDYRPLFLRAFSGGIEPVETLVWDVRRFNAIGAEVPVRVELFNDGSEPAVFRADMWASSGFRADPAVWEATLPAGERITLEGILVPEGSTAGTLNRVQLQGSFGVMPFSRAAQFAIGEGSGTIPYATQPIRVDGNTEDWGDLAERVPLVELANFERDGFGDAGWSGPDDLSAKFHAAWTETGLYWLALVRDDNPLGCPEGVMAYSSDAIELFLDGRSPEMQWDSTVGEGTVQLVVTPALDGLPSATYRRPGHLQAEYATGTYEGGYRIEGFIPFDPMVFPAGEWLPGRTVKLALQVIDRDKPASDGTGGGRKALGWGITRATIADRLTGEERESIRTHSDTTGWKTLILGE